MSQIFLGLVGPIASGKGVVADHLKDLDFDVYSLSDVVRKEALRLGLPLKREVLQDVGDMLRKNHGNQVLAERVLQIVTDTTKNLVFDSIRNPSEIKYFQSLLDIKIITVDAPVETRLKWYLKRAYERGEDNPDVSAFTQAILRDSGEGQPLNGQQVMACMGLSDIKLFNSGTKSELLLKVDGYLRSELNFDPEIHRQSKEK